MRLKPALRMAAIAEADRVMPFVAADRGTISAPPPAWETKPGAFGLRRNPAPLDQMLDALVSGRVHSLRSDWLIVTGEVDKVHVCAMGWNSFSRELAKSPVKPDFKQRSKSYVTAFSQ